MIKRAIQLLIYKIFRYPDLQKRNPETGITIYQQSMFVMSHMLIIVASLNGNINQVTLEDLMDTLLVFCRRILWQKEDKNHLRKTILDMEQSLKKMDLNEFERNNIESCNLVSALPPEMINGIAEYLAVFHLKNRLRLDPQAQKLQYDKTIEMFGYCADVGHVIKKTEIDDVFANAKQRLSEF